MAANTHSALARKLVAQFPDAPSMTLAKRLYAENKLKFRDVEAARDAVRYVRGNRGSVHRKKPGVTHKRPNGKSGWIPACPPSKAEPWEPFVLPAPCRVLSLSDAHVPYQDTKALEAAVTYARKHFNPDVLLLNGDHADFYSISKWETEPNKRDLVAELGIVEDSLSWLRGIFPKALRIYKQGNHEDRYNKFIWNKAPELWGLANVQMENILHLDRWGFEMVKDERPILAGALPIFHGHELPKGGSPVSPARGAYMRTAHTILIGHQHRASSHTEPDLWHSETTCWSQGCLCNLRPKYARINKWSHGFVVIDVDKSGEFNLHNFKIAKDGKVRTV